MYHRRLPNVAYVFVMSSGAHKTQTRRIAIPPLGHPQEASKTQSMHILNEDICIHMLEITTQVLTLAVASLVLWAWVITQATNRGGVFHYLDRANADIPTRWGLPAKRVSPRLSRLLIRQNQRNVLRTVLWYLRVPLPRGTIFGLIEAFKLDNC